MSVRHHQNRRSERTLAFDAAPELGSPSRCGLGQVAWPVVVAVMLAAGVLMLAAGVLMLAAGGAIVLALS